MRSILQDVLDRIPGALGAAVVGFDGIPVERVAVDDGAGIDLASAEGITLVRRAAGLGGRQETPEEISVSTSAGMTILRSLGQEYYLCLVVGPESIPGRARYEAWRAGLALRQALR